MSGARTGLSIGVIVALAVAVWAAVSADEDEVPEGSATTTSVTTSTTATPTTTNTAAPATTTSATSVPDTTPDPEARVDEVRLILEDLYFRWFDAIYRNDEEAVMDVVATESYLDAFHQAVESLDLPRAPVAGEVVVTDVEILRDEASCLVTFSRLDLSAWRGPEAVTAGVNVLLPVTNEWRFGTAWTNRNDLWEPDCLIEPELG